jgi:hypothetical protein
MAKRDWRKRYKKANRKALIMHYLHRRLKCLKERNILKEEFEEKLMTAVKKGTKKYRYRCGRVEFFPRRSMYKITLTISSNVRPTEFYIKCISD